MRKGHKRVVTNLFAGQESRHRLESGHVDTSEADSETGERVSGQICTTMWTTGMWGSSG